MLGLLKDFGITALIIILNHWVYGVEDTVSYDFVVNFITGKKTLFLATGIIGSIVLLVSTSIEELGLYKVTYAISKIFIRLCQFLITFLSILNIVFYSAGGMNLLRASGYSSLIVLFMILGSSCWTIRANDFSYNTQNALVPVGVLAFLSVVLVEFVWPMAGI
jgi:hypothetical protein